jgi:hypothetical protein
MVDRPRIAPPPTSRQHGHTKLQVRCRISAEQGDYGPERCYALHHGSRKHHTAPHTSSRWISSPVHNALQPLSWGPPMPPREGPTPRQRRSRRRRSLHLAENTAVSHPRSSSERAVRSTLQQPRSNGLGHGSAAEPARMPAHGEDFTELPAMRGERDEGRTLGETEKNRH